jgi:hypothetical protein
MRTDRTHSTRLPFTALAIVLLVTACTGSPAATVTPAPTAPAVGATPIPAATPGRSIPQPVATPVPAEPASLPQGLRDEILADAAARTGVPAADITVVSAVAMTWPDSALGCPKPGSMYTQMIEPGFQVVVDAAGKTLDYRVGSRGTPRLCENPPGPG